MSRKNCQAKTLELHTSFLGKYATDVGLKARTMCHDSLLSALSHHLLHAAAISGAVVAVTTLALCLELFRHLLVRLGASAEMLDPLSRLARGLVALDLLIIGAMALKGAVQALWCLGV